MAFIIPKEDCDKIIDVLAGNYGLRLKNERFNVTGRVEPTFVEIKVVLYKLDQTQSYWMEFRAALMENKMSEEEALDLILDFIGYYLDHYFDSHRDLILPLDFQPYEIGDGIVYARGDITNPSLDAEADRILEAGIRLENQGKS
ncbi:MAG TPA: hypothetical protein PK329_00530 [Myxococcota bacterium]|jgi:hypothetical protein|nr:hypothetical protein [Myxococcota bacterium]